jgi:phospholipase D1/2
LPYFKFLNSQRVDDLSHNEFARIQRESLENYLLGLIRAVVCFPAVYNCDVLTVVQMFHPSSNRLSGFLEVSALSISLAQTGGAQYKAGFLRIEASSKGSGFGRKGVSWKDKRKTRWCAVRESYLIVVDEPGEVRTILFVIEKSHY